MYEFDIKNKKTGAQDTIFGHAVADAFKRHNLNPDDWIVINWNYID